MEESNYIPIVFDIFKNFFGEENVDLVGDNYIIVHFPKVTVTNENDKSIDITELWVKVHICRNGCLLGTFSMIRSEYTQEQFNSGYLHSHVPSITSASFNSWKDPCLGTGPLRITTTSLNSEFSEEIWNLFCLELSKYVETESLIGGPYTRLERVGDASNATKIEFPIVYDYEVGSVLSPLKELLFGNFIQYIIHKRPFNFNYMEHYDIAASNYDAFVLLSNLFIEWFNSWDDAKNCDIENLFYDNILCKVNMVNNSLYVPTNQISTEDFYDNIIGTPILEFKGETIKLNIIKSEDKPHNNEFIVLTPTSFRTIITILLKTINLKYGRSNLANKEELGFI